ncbi:MAG: hypothetical protein AAFO94_09545 [Bacteroidota bacterium]
MARFFKLPKHNSFNYKPRYYDPAKEELEERVSKYADKARDDKEAMKARITGGFRTRGGYNRGYDASRGKALRRAGVIRLLLVIGLLLLAIVLLSEKLTTFTQYLEGGS